MIQGGHRKNENAQVFFQQSDGRNPRSRPFKRLSIIDFSGSGFLYAYLDDEEDVNVSTIHHFFTLTLPSLRVNNNTKIFAIQGLVGVTELVAFDPNDKFFEAKEQSVKTACLCDFPDAIEEDASLLALQPRDSSSIDVKKTTFPVNPGSVLQASFGIAVPPFLIEEIGQYQATYVEGIIKAS